MTTSLPSEKRFVQGTARAVETTQGRKIINISINVQQLKEISNDQGYAKIALYELRKIDEYGNTHFIVDNS